MSRSVGEQDHGEEGSVELSARRVVFDGLLGAGAANWAETLARLPVVIWILGSDGGSESSSWMIL